MKANNLMPHFLYLQLLFILCNKVSKQLTFIKDKKKKYIWFQHKQMISLSPLSSPQVPAPREQANKKVDKEHEAATFLCIWLSVELFISLGECVDMMLWGTELPTAWRWTVSRLARGSSWHIPSPWPGTILLCQAQQSLSETATGAFRCTEKNAHATGELCAHYATHKRWHACTLIQKDTLRLSGCPKPSPFGGLLSPV